MDTTSETERLMIGRRAFLSSGLGAAAAATAPSQGSRLNVLFIAVDDLRPELPCYGNAAVQAPNIERLAGRGMVFESAYCQAPVCGPSRASLLTGLRPDTTRVWANKAEFRDTLPDLVTLPQRFKEAGYRAEAIGKILHGNKADPRSFSVPAWPPGGRQAGMQYVDTARLASMRAAEPRRSWTGEEIPTLTWKKRKSWQAPEVPDNALQDGQVADRAVAALRRLQGQQFFLAVGFQKPHLPFTAPRRYFDLYDPRELEVNYSQDRPIGSPDVAFTRWQELRGYTDIPDEGPLPPGKARELIHGYYAATSYMDAQLGRVLRELESLGLERRTVVMLFGDHGWHLGERARWAKTTTFELDARAPLILHVPGMRSGGVKSDRIVEFVDMYPTLCDACGIAPPADLEGVSMLPLLEDPRRAWKSAAFTQITRPYLADQDWEFMGYSMRTERFRYTEWLKRDRSVHVRELYDLSGAPTETENLAHASEYRTVVEELSGRLQSGWRHALPPRHG